MEKERIPSRMIELKFGGKRARGTKEEETGGAQTAMKERLSKLPESSAAPIRQCTLVEQITHLIDSTCSGQTLLVSITMPPSQGSSNASTPQSNGVGVPGSSRGRARARPPYSSERTKRLALRLHMQDNSEEDTSETGE
ncbi:unnamed protein product [Timema podura]|uniref:Uncharacterized protein n=1 Tax=Timema podura TaxID=61482 RepID=A0ABN7PLA6_TIMPD|nr:unnamed protein product [Timema podura]